MFKGLLEVNYRCRACGLDLARFDVADSPAFYLTIFWVVVVAGLAALTWYLVRTPYWVHLIIWPVLLMVLVLGTVRPLKAGIIAIGYAYRMGKIKL